MFDIMLNGGYSGRKSLEPLQTRQPAPVRRGFFTPVVRPDCWHRASYGREGCGHTTPAREKPHTCGLQGSNLPAAFMSLAVNPIRTGAKP